jgi:hypothetical protein
MPALGLIGLGNVSGDIARDVLSKDCAVRVETRLQLRMTCVKQTFQPRSPFAEAHRLVFLYLPTNLWWMTRLRSRQVLQSWPTPEIPLSVSIQGMLAPCRQAAGIGTRHLRDQMVRHATFARMMVDGSKPALYGERQPPVAPTQEVGGLSDGQSRNAAITIWP